MVLYQFRGQTRNQENVIIPSVFGNMAPNE